MGPCSVKLCANLAGEESTENTNDAANYCTFIVLVKDEANHVDGEQNEKRDCKFID